MNANHPIMRQPPPRLASADLQFDRSVRTNGCRIGLPALGQGRPSVPFEPETLPVPGRVASGGLKAWQVDRVLAYIETHIETSLLATELAALARLSGSYFFRAFKISFGQSPHAYILSRRVACAKRLMMSADPPSLAEIALCCGLADQAHLSRVFRRLVGETPGAWRRKYRVPAVVQREQAGLSQGWTATDMRAALATGVDRI